MVFSKIKKAVKKYFAPVFDPTKKESGLVGTIVVATLVAGGLAWWFKGEIGKEILYASGALILGVTKILFKISSEIFTTVTGSALLQKPLTQNPTVLHGWTIVRDFANMFIVLGFVVVGIATILRLREYEAQKTLLPLILVALLINFSLLICGIIIDATNITINYFTVISRPAGITTQLEPLINDPKIDNELALYKNDSDWQNFASLSFSTGIYIGISAMIFFIYAVLFLFRYVALMLLIILAPLAFVCYVFSATKPIFNKWWNQFIQWSIIGIPAAFFIYLGGHIFQSYSNGTDHTLAFWIPVGFLLFAYTLIFQTSAIGASSAIGLATGAVGMAWGATKWTGGKALRGTGSFAGKNSRIGQAAGDWANKHLENWGLAKTGSTKQRQSERIAEAGKRIDSLETSQKVDLANSKPMSAQARVDKARAIEQLAKGGKIDKVKDIELALSHADAYGANKDDLYKHPLTAQYNKTKIDEYTKPVAMGGKGLSEKVARQQLTDEAYQNAKVQALKDLPDKAVNETFMKNVMLKNPEKMAKVAEDTSQKNVDNMKKWKTKHDTTGKILPLAQQSPEFQKLFGEMNALPAGSPEKAVLRQQMANMQRVLQNNSSFV